MTQPLLSDADGGPARPGFVGRAGGSLVGSLVATASIGAAGILSSRLLGPEGKGRASVALVGATALAVLVVAGRDLWVATHLGREGWTRAAAVVTRRTVVTVILIAVAVGATGAAVGAEVGAELGGIAVAAGGTALLSVALAVASGLHRTRTLVVVQGAGGALALLATALVVAADRPSVAIVVAAVGVGRGLGSLWALVATRVDRREHQSTMPPPSGRELRRFGWPAALGTALTLGIYRLDTVLVAVILGAADAGRYAVAATLTELLWVVPDAVAVVLAPEVAATSSFSQTARAVRLTGAVVAGGGLLVAVAGPWLIPALFGDGFEGAAAALVPLCFASVALGAWKLVAADLAGRGHTAVRLRSIGVGLAVMIGSDLVLIPTIGVVGAGVGSLLGYVAALGVAVRTWQSVGGSAGALLGVRRTDLAALVRARNRGTR